MEAKDRVAEILEEARRRANDLANSTEGNFKEEDIEGIYQDAYMAIYQAGIRAVGDKRGG